MGEKTLEELGGYAMKKQCPHSQQKKIGGGSMEIPLIAVPPITVRPIATEKLPLGYNRHIEVLNEHIESDCKRR
jgi:hypothetical protein